MNIKSSEIKKITINEDGSVEILTIPGISRYESNGIIASLISISKKTIEGKDVTKEIEAFEKEHMGYYEALNSIVFTAWDALLVDEYFEAKSNMPYHFRFSMLISLLSKRDFVNVRVVENKIVDSYEEAMAHFQEMLNRGEEGTIVKSYMGTWKDGKPNWQIKCILM